MKYLKKFNESNDISEFCNDYLSYLIDDGFKVKVDENCKYIEYSKKLVHKNTKLIGNKSHYEYVSKDMGTFLAKISITKPISKGALEFKFDDIKDHLIPFLIFLNEEYKVEIIKFRGINGYYTIEQILKPSFKFKPNIHLLNILINKK